MEACRCCCPAWGFAWALGENAIGTCLHILLRPLVEHRLPTGRRQCLRASWIEQCRTPFGVVPAVRKGDFAVARVGVSLCRAERRACLQTKPPPQIPEERPEGRVYS